MGLQFLGHLDGAPDLLRLILVAEIKERIQPAHLQAGLLEQTQKILGIGDRARVDLDVIHARLLGFLHGRRQRAALLRRYIAQMIQKYGYSHCETPSLIVECQRP